MDAKNTFHTKTTYRIIRGEHLLVLFVTGGLMIWQANEVNWWRAFFAFWIIDIIGYLPGALAFRKSENDQVNHWYHHAYNVCHTYLVCATGVAIWAYAQGAFEWAMLAVPFHLSVDRGVFGNILKPIQLSFEPRDHSDQDVLSALGRFPTEQTTDKEITGLVADDLVTEVLDHPSGYLSLSSRNEKFVVDGLSGFISFREQGKHYWMFGGVHAVAEDAAELLDRFILHAASKDRRVAAVQVRSNQVGLFRSRGFTVNQLGSTYAVSLADYSLKGGKKAKLRNKVKKAQKSGLRVVEFGIDVPSTDQWREQIHAISDQWLAAKGKSELDFMVGELGELGSNDSDQRRVFLVVDASEKVIAFIAYVPVMGTEHPGYLHDLTRKTPDAPTGAMELCNATAIERFQAENVPFLHFGFTPFMVDENHERNANAWLHRVIHWLRKHGARLYPAESQAAYKTKWGTDHIAREYLAVKPLSMRAAFDLLRLTKTI